MNRLSLFGGSAAFVIIVLCSNNLVFLSKLGLKIESSTHTHIMDGAAFQMINVDSVNATTSVETRTTRVNQPTSRKPNLTHIPLPIVNATNKRSQGALDTPNEFTKMPSSASRSKVKKSESKRFVIANNTANMEYPDVCFYGSTRFFFGQTTTKQFVMNFLTVLRNVSLRSFNDALIAKNKIHVLLPISSFKPHFKSVDDVIKFLKPVVDTYNKLEVTFTRNAHAIAKQRFKHTKCKWVVITKLDADDVIFPGFLDWIVQKVIPTLDRGAVVGGQYMNRLVMGYDLCTVKTNVGPFHWPGEAMAQTRVIRRDVFLRLRTPFEAPAHTAALRNLRRGVFNLLFKGEPLPIPLVQNSNGARLNYSQEKLWDSQMENITGIRMVEPSLALDAFGPPSVYLKSPLSSHFLYENIGTMPRCTDSEWASTWDKATHQNAVKSNMDYIHTTLQGLNFSVYDTCKSHSFFSDFFASTSNLAWFGNATTCEQMEERLQIALKA